MPIPFSFIALGLILAEIAAFIVVGKAIGVLATLALTVLAMVAGTMLLRWTGMQTLMRVRSDLAAERAPGRPLAQGAAQAVGALLLIVPGFVTDVMGLLLFVPPVRELLWRSVSRRVHVTNAGPGRPAQPPRADGGVLDLDRGEYHRAGPQADSPWRRDAGSAP